MNQLLIALCLCSADLGAPCCDPPVQHGEGAAGEMTFRLINRNDPCYRGLMFPALKITRAYRDNEAFAYHHFEDKRLTVSGRLVSIKKRLAVPYVELDPVTGKVIRDADGRYALVERDVFVALVTPDGKFPAPKIDTADGVIKEQFGLEFRFPIDKLAGKPATRCNIASLWAGQFVTLKGDCRGAYPSPDGYTAIIFENTEIVP